MDKKIILLTLFSVFLLSAMVVTSSAPGRVVGVTVGNWFKYGTIDISWSSNDPNATFPPPGYEWLKEMNETEWTLMSVVNISGTNITCQGTTRFKNGTQVISGGYVDIDTGTGVNVTFMAISANLNANDTLYTSGPYSSFTINQTVARTYPDSVRDTNHLNYTWEYSWTVNETQHYYYYTINSYWDRSTGILVEDYFETINQTGEYLTTWSALSRITESNVWVVPELPTSTSIMLTLIALAVAIFIYKRRLLKAPVH